MGEGGGNIFLGPKHKNFRKKGGGGGKRCKKKVGGGGGGGGANILSSIVRETKYTENIVLQWSKYASKVSGRQLFSCK